jgi:hypothetical protein
MKKIFAIAVLAATFATTGAFGQGYFVMSTGKSQAFDGFSTAGTSTVDTKVGVALFWAAASTQSPFTSYLTSTPTGGNSTTTESYTAAQAWAALTGSSFVQGTSTAIGGNVQAQTSATGVLKFNNGVTFDMAGTTAGTTYSLILISYDATQYANAAAAAAAGGAIGWSQVVQFTAASNIGTPSSPSIGQFGTFAPATIPEPTTIALAGLGGLALLGLRRKK